MYNGVIENNADSRKLYTRIQNRIDQGISQREHLVEKVASMVIRDRLVPPRRMEFCLKNGDKDVALKYGNEEEAVDIHRHALNQLASKVRFPMTYLNELNSEEPKAEDPDWRRRQLVHCLNGHYQNGVFPADARFLHRLVGNQLRGFLSRRFNRHLASLPLLRAFVGACESMNAQPFDAIATDVKFALRCCLPFVFEPIPDEFVCLGVEWSNSDFGSGRMQVALTLWMPKGDRFGVLDNSLSRVHIGSVIEDADLDISEEAAQKEADAQSLAIRDVVKGKLSPGGVDRVLKAIALAHEEEVPWHRLRGQLSKFLNKNDISTLEDALSNDILDLPPVKHVDGERTASKWWASAAMSWLANKTEDDEKRMELQHAAGSILSPFVNKAKVEQFAEHGGMA